MFEVLIYQNLSDVDGEEGYLDCSESPISFVSSTSDPDEAPFLTVHSYDLALDKIDYNSVKKSATQKVCSCVNVCSLYASTLYPPIGGY